MGGGGFIFVFKLVIHRDHLGHFQKNKSTDGLLSRMKESTSQWLRCEVRTGWHQLGFSETAHSLIIVSTQMLFPHYLLLKKNAIWWVLLAWWQGFSLFSRAVYFIICQASQMFGFAAPCPSPEKPYRLISGFDVGRPDPRTQRGSCRASQGSRVEIKLKPAGGENRVY